MFAAPKVKPDAIPDHRPDYSAGSGHPPEDRAEKTNVRVLPVRGRHSAKPARLPASSPRRRWLSRAVLLVILAAQAVLTLRMHNTAFEDEALYLYVGHLEIAHWLHGASLQGNYPSYFSGSPVLYPVLGAVADSIGGLVAARAVSLIEMLATTALLYALARRLFNERVALCGAVIFSVTEPTLYLGHLATYDATALCLLALAAWLVVRTAEFPWPAYLLAAPLTALAVASKYASLLFVPSVVLLAGLAAWPRHGRKALIRPIAVAVTVAGLLAGALYLGGANYLQGVRFTTLERFQGTAPRATLLWDSLQWAGLPFALAVIGSVAYAVRPYNEPGEQIAPGGSRLRRIMLGAVLAGSAMLAPAEQIRIYTLVSLYKHIGFGLFFAAPIAGVGLARVVGDHFRRAQVGIAIWGATLALGMTQANNLFNAWPNSSKFVADMSVHLRPGARYLVEVDEVPIYYLRHHSDAQPDQFTSTYFIGYVDQQGKYVTGNAAYVAAIKAGYFQMVGYNYQTTPSVDGVLARTLATSSFYRLAAAIPNGNDSVTQYLWVRTARPASHRVSRRRAGP